MVRLSTLRRDLRAKTCKISQQVCTSDGTEKRGWYRLKQMYTVVSPFLYEVSNQCITMPSTYSTVATLKDFVFDALTRLQLSQNTSIDDFIVERVSDPAHGHFSTTVALKLYGALQKDAPELLASLQVSNPRELAQKIADELVQGTTEVFADVSVAGAGFVNMRLTTSFILAQLSDHCTEAAIQIDQELQDQKIMVEFTDPNPFKELHIGHLYSNTVGEAISRILEAQGAIVHRACYQGDVGMHVAKSIWGMRQLFTEEFAELSYSEALQKLEMQNLSSRVKFLGRSYAVGATAYKEDPAAAEEMKDINYLTFLSGQENLVAEGGWEPQVDYRQYVAQTNLDFEEIKTLYTQGRAWSLDYFNQMYERIGMQFDNFFYESVVGEYGAKIVKEFLKKGVFEESQGAVIFPGKKHGLHDRVFINSLGLPTYEAKELGLAPEKYRRFAYDTSLIITGNEIDEYFKVLLKALEFTNPDLRAKTKHLSHGMVRLPEGKMSSRTGKILSAQWLIDEAHTRITTVLADTREHMSQADRDQISEVVGLSAIKFAFLKQSVGKDIAFNFEESLAFSGNSGPYLLYSYVRTKSVLQKAEDAAKESQKRSIAKQFVTIIKC